MGVWERRDFAYAREVGDVVVVDVAVGGNNDAAYVAVPAYFYRFDRSFELDRFDGIALVVVPNDEVFGRPVGRWASTHKRDDVGRGKGFDNANTFSKIYGI